MSGPVSESRPDDRLPRNEALAAVAMSVVWADGQVVDDELETLRRGLVHAGPAPAEEGELADLLLRMRELYAEEGRDALLETAAESLEDGSSMKAFALAVDVALADSGVTLEESETLDRVREALEVPQMRAQLLVDGLAAKHARPIQAGQLPEQDADRREPPEIEESEALVAFLVRAAKERSEGPPTVSPSDLPPLRGLEDASSRQRERLVRRAERGLSTVGEQAYLEACATALDPEARRQAFVLAADALFADRRLTEPEHALLAELRELLGVPPDEAAQISDAVWTKHLR